MRAVRKHVDSRPVGTRKLVMLTPNYLTTNQSNVHERITTPLPRPVFGNLSLKAFGEFKPVSASCLDRLLGACNKPCTCLQPNPVSVPALYWTWVSGPELASAASGGVRS